jgi:hypothetical protein
MDIIARQQEAVMSLLTEPLFFVTAVIVALLLTAANKTVFGQPAPQHPMIIEETTQPLAVAAGHSRAGQHAGHTPTGFHSTGRPEGQAHNPAGFLFGDRMLQAGGTVEGGAPAHRTHPSRRPG